MAVTTYTEYLAEEHVLDLTAQAGYDAANTEHAECLDEAQKKHDQTMQMLATVHPTTAAEAQALADAKEAADKLFVEEKDKCDKERADKIDATSLAYWTALENLQKEAADNLARVERLIITLDELQPAAVALQDLIWPTATTRAPILTVSSLDDLRREFERDCGMFELLLMVRAEDGELIFGADRRKISEIVSDVQSTVKLHVLEIVHLRGELTGAAPDDTDSLSILGTSSIGANWSVHVPHGPSPTAEIQVNDTPPGDVGVVLVKCAHPSARAVVPCRIQLTPPFPSSDVTIVLHDPKNRLRFPDAADTTVTLPKAGGFVPFEISGHAPSRAVGDAVIEARVGSVAGPVCGTQRVTVVSFTLAEMILKQGGNYGFTGDLYSAAGAAMWFSASATIEPSGVDCSVPQLASLGVGIMQEVSRHKETVTYDRPIFDPHAPPPSGTKGPAPKSVRVTVTYDPSVAQPMNDGKRKEDYPLYDRGPGAFTIPLGCVNAGGAATSSDNPLWLVPATITQPVSIPSVGVFPVIWTRRVKVTRREHFRTFCVIFDTSTNQFCALKQATWELDLDDSRATDQHAAVTSNNEPATANPAARGVDQQANNPALQKAEADFVGGHTTIRWPP